MWTVTSWPFGPCSANRSAWPEPARSRAVSPHEYGRKLGEASGELTGMFPSAATIAALSPDQLPMPRGRARAVIALATALASGDLVLDAGADRDAVAGRLVAIPGIGPWTVAYVRMRALGDPDAFLASDLGVRRALEARGLPGDPRSATAVAEAWRPWRSYALQYLWSTPVGPGCGLDPTAAERHERSRQHDHLDRRPAARERRRGPRADGRLGDMSRRRSATFSSSRTTWDFASFTSRAASPPGPTSRPRVRPPPPWRGSAASSMPTSPVS